MHLARHVGGVPHAHGVAGGGVPLAARVFKHAAPDACYCALLHVHASNVFGVKIAAVNFGVQIFRARGCLCAHAPPERQRRHRIFPGDKLPARNRHLGSGVGAAEDGHAGLVAPGGGKGAAPERDMIFAVTERHRAVRGGDTAALKHGGNGGVFVIAENAVHCGNRAACDIQIHGGFAGQPDALFFTAQRGGAGEREGQRAVCRVGGIRQQKRRGGGVGGDDLCRAADFKRSIRRGGDQFDGAQRGGGLDGAAHDAVMQPRLGGVDINRAVAGV